MVGNKISSKFFINNKICFRINLCISHSGPISETSGWGGKAEMLTLDPRKTDKGAVVTEKAS